MNDSDVGLIEKEFKKHNFLIFIVGSIVVAVVIIFVAMTMYYASGTAQLDLSRPGYVSVRAQATNSADFKNFPSNGKLNVGVIEDFQSQYNEQTQKVKTVDAFGGDPLSPSALGIDAEFNQ